MPRLHRLPSFRLPLLSILLILAVTATILLAMGRSAICRCGHVAIWHGALDSGNSQHLLDWYSPSHLIHGFLFYLAGWLMLRHVSTAWRLVAATLVEAAWEIAENTPAIIDRYRTATMALGYTGDGVVNSMADIGWAS
jgi:hypothetical protein